MTTATLDNPRVAAWQARRSEPKLEPATAPALTPSKTGKCAICARPLPKTAKPDADGNPTPQGWCSPHRRNRKPGHAGRGFLKRSTSQDIGAMIARENRAARALESARDAVAKANVPLLSEQVEAARRAAIRQEQRAMGSTDTRRARSIPLKTEQIMVATSLGTYQSARVLHAGVPGVGRRVRNTIHRSTPDTLFPVDPRRTRFDSKQRVDRFGIRRAADGSIEWHWLPLGQPGYLACDTSQALGIVPKTERQHVNLAWYRDTNDGRITISTVASELTCEHCYLLLVASLLQELPRV